MHGGDVACCDAMPSYRWPVLTVLHWHTCVLVCDCGVWHAVCRWTQTRPLSSRRRHNESSQHSNHKTNCGRARTSFRLRAVRVIVGRMNFGFRTLQCTKHRQILHAAGWKHLRALYTSAALAAFKKTNDGVAWRHAPIFSS